MSEMLSEIRDELNGIRGDNTEEEEEGEIVTGL